MSFKKFTRFISSPYVLGTAAVLFAFGVFSTQIANLQSSVKSALNLS